MIMYVNYIKLARPIDGIHIILHVFPHFEGQNVF